jgi:hypothetical protein
VHAGEWNGKKHDEADGRQELRPNELDEADRGRARVQPKLATTKSVICRHRSDKRGSAHDRERVHFTAIGASVRAPRRGPFSSRRVKARMDGCRSISDQNHFPPFIDFRWRMATRAMGD